MRRRLGIKFFLVFLAIAAVVAGAMAIATRWSMGRGFVDYLNQNQEERLHEIGMRLEDLYARHGSWAPFYVQPRLWPELTRDGSGMPPMAEPPPPRWGRGERPEDGIEDAAMHRSPWELGPRLTLFDAEKRAVIGRDGDSSGLLLHPLYHQGVTVGWLGVRPLKTPAEARDVAFLHEQGETLFYIAVLMVLVAAVASVFVARRLQRPIAALTEGAQKLSQGTYGTRVPVQGEDELASLAAHFNRLAEALQRHEGARQRWIADISHELRTPLTVLRGEIEAIQDGVRPVEARALASLHAEAVHLGKLVDDLYQLSLSDLGALNYHMGSVDLTELVQDVMSSFAPRFAKAGLSVEEPACGPAMVKGDPDRLRQLVHNLLENSLRYTDGGGRLRVSIGASGDRIALCVEDSAPGVPSEQLASLFEPLYRGESSRNRRTGGAGLGLAICRNIVEAHGGEIVAHASSLGGLAVTVRLPPSGEQET